MHVSGQKIPHFSGPFKRGGGRRGGGGGGSHCNIELVWYQYHSGLSHISSLKEILKHICIKTYTVSLFQFIFYLHTIDTSRKNINQQCSIETKSSTPDWECWQWVGDYQNHDCLAIFFFVYTEKTYIAKLWYRCT